MPISEEGCLPGKGRKRGNTPNSYITPNEPCFDEADLTDQLTLLPQEAPYLINQGPLLNEKTLEPIAILLLCICAALSKCPKRFTLILVMVSLQ